MDNPLKNTTDAPQKNPASGDNDSETSSLVSDGIFEMIRKMGKAEKPSKEVSKVPSCKQGLRPGWRKVTVIMRDEHFEQLKEISYWEQVPVKNIIEFVLNNFLKSRKPKEYPKISPKDP